MTEIKETKEEKKTKEKIVKEPLPEIKPGMTVRVHQKIKELTAKGEEKEKIQIFEGIVIAKKGEKKPSATITVRKISSGVGVEKIFPIYSPVVVKIEPVKKAEVRRAKLHYLRTYGKRLKETAI